MLRLPVWRLWPGLRRPTSLISTQSVCSGCGSDSMSCSTESWFEKVTCVPRLTVRLCGQTVLFMMTNVVGLERGVHDPLGPVLLDDEPLQDMAAHIRRATIRAPATRLT